MGDTESISWIWLGLPLVGLALNLIWPRSKKLKAVGLAILVLVAWLYGSPFFGMNSSFREFIAIEGNMQRIGAAAELHQAVTFTLQVIFDLSLASTLGVFLAAIPVNVLQTLYARWNRSKAQPKASSETRDAYTSPKIS